MRGAHGVTSVNRSIAPSTRWLASMHSAGIFTTSDQSANASLQFNSSLTLTSNTMSRTLKRTQGHRMNSMISQTLRTASRDSTFTNAVSNLHPKASSEPSDRNIALIGIHARFSIAQACVHCDGSASMPRRDWPCHACMSHQQP
jgi:hypothetical protein